MLQLSNRVSKVIVCLWLLGSGIDFTMAQQSRYTQNDFKRDSSFAAELTAQIDTLFFNDQQDSCLYVIEKAIPFYEKLGLDKFLIHALTRRGAIYRVKGQFSLSMADFNRVLEYHRRIGNIKSEAATLNQIGAIYRLRGEYPTALDYYFRSLSLYQRIGYEPGVSSVLNNIGVVHLYQKLYDKALGYYNQSLAIEEKQKNDEGIGTSFLNIGEVYRKKGELSKASDYYLRALVYASRTNDLDAIGTIYNELAGINIDNGSLADVLKYLNLARESFIKMNSPLRRAECELNFGNYYKKRGELTKSISHYSEALKLAKANKLLDIESAAHFHLSSIFERLGQNTPAFEHFKRYIATRDSLFNEENTRRSLEAEYFYKFERQQEQHRIEQAKKEAEYAERMRRDRAIRMSLIVIISMGAILIGFILFYLRKIKHKNEELSYHQREILEKNEELQQQQEEILAQRDEIERKNIILEQSQQIIADKNERMISSIEYAKTIQNALLPKAEKFSELFKDYFVIYEPKDIVSGDFYWVSGNSNLICAAVMDCTGHGVPGAFMSMIGNTLLNKIVNEWGVATPSKVLDSLNDQLVEALKQKETGNKVLAGIDIAFITIDRKNHKVYFAGAGRPLLVIQNGTMTKLNGNIRSTGGFQPASLKPYQDVSFDLVSPTFVYLFSDGYADQISADKRKFGQQRLFDLIYQSYLKPMSAQRDLLIQMMQNHLHGTDQIDDICVVGLRID